ncbi:TPA: hypothetical protein HA239_04015 [Candidatus Woesearchaeota archaeon]|nr:hypothetical protein QT06_C0001G0779 [archaeon GW2011_AR15]MBS3103441.1 hypothetical protein [Candidatus Woesearchaeota archaeon]HIH41558.1 hypothetical protein [Candidatus Woesearchaeota archaeon]
MTLSNGQKRMMAALGIYTAVAGSLLPWIPRKEVYDVNVLEIEHFEDYSRIMHEQGLEMGFPVDRGYIYINYSKNSDYFEKYQSEVPSIEAGDLVRMTSFYQQSPLEIVVWSMVDSLPGDAWILNFMLGYDDHTEYQILK